MNMIEIKGNIDSNNAEQFEKELMDSAMKIPVTELVLDAGKLDAYVTPNAYSDPERLVPV